MIWWLNDFVGDHFEALMIANALTFVGILCAKAFGVIGRTDATVKPLEVIIHNAMLAHQRRILDSLASRFEGEARYITTGETIGENDSELFVPHKPMILEAEARVEFIPAPAHPRACWACGAPWEASCSYCGVVHQAPPIVANFAPTADANPDAVNIIRR